MNKTLYLGLCGIAACCLAGCATRPKASSPDNVFVTNARPTVIITNATDPALLRPPVAPFTLGPGDEIDVEMLSYVSKRDDGKPDSYRAELTVGPDGKIYYQLLPGLDVSGLTLAQTKARLEKELTQYVSEPQVVVTLRAVHSKQVWMMGRLNQPGIYPLTGPMTLIEAITLAGGTAQSASVVTTVELADLRHSFVLRNGEVLPVDFRRLLREGDMTQNIYMQPDDFVFVPSSLSKEVFVLGAVNATRAIPYKDNLTLVGAIADSGGLIQKVSYGSHVAIVRGSMSQPEVVIVDYNAIIKGAAQDVLLEPRDIVYVPDSPYKTLYKYANMIVNSFVGAIAANEGARAVDPNAAGVSVSVPVGGASTSSSGGNSGGSNGGGKNN